MLCEFVYAKFSRSFYRRKLVKIYVKQTFFKKKNQFQCPKFLLHFPTSHLHCIEFKKSLNLSTLFFTINRNSIDIFENIFHVDNTIELCYNTSSHPCMKKVFLNIKIHRYMFSFIKLYIFI